ncbi:MAG: hypothetical protein VR70_10910 [Rhodospirillaceae bacterium BRH_c57]|nr:MAG: hypothetical protein VR70_10910 [Rhodospirillaceae bacterium BRH_c57]
MARRDDEDWGRTVAEAWRRLLPSTVAGGDGKGFGRVTLSRKSRDAHGESGGSHAVLDTWPFVSTDSGIDRLAEKFGHQAGSEGASEVRRWAASVLEVWEATCEVWGSDGERVSMARVNAVVEAAHAASLAASAVAIGFGDWINEEGRFSPEGGESWWDGDFDGWTMVGPSPASEGFETAGFPWGVRRFLSRLSERHDLADAIAAANAEIGSRSHLWKDNPPLPGSVEWEEARALLETGAVRVAVADIMWANKGKVRGGKGLARFNRVNPMRVLALAEKALALRWGGRAASLLLARYDLQPLTAMDTETLLIPDLDPETGEDIVVVVEGRRDPEGGSEEVAEAIFERAVAQADAALAMAAFVLGNRDRRRQCMERLFGLSAEALSGEWSHVPAFAWQRGRGVRTRYLEHLLPGVERAARSAKTLVSPDPSPEYSEAMASKGANAAIALVACGLIDLSEPSEASDWDVINGRKIKGQKKDEAGKARKRLSRAAGQRLKRTLVESAAEAVLLAAGEEAVAKACESARRAMGEGKDKAARWNLPDWTERCRSPGKSFWASVDAVAEAASMEGLREIAAAAERETATSLLERGGEAARNAVSLSLLGGDPVAGMESLVTLVSQGKLVPKAGLHTSPVPPPDVWLLYGCARTVLETATPERREGPLLGKSSPARWLANCLRAVAGEEIKEAETRHLIPVLKALEGYVKHSSGAVSAEKSPRVGDEAIDR